MISQFTETFSENDNSAQLYKESLIEYLQDVLKNNRFQAMSDHQIYLDWIKDTLESVIELIKK